MAADRLRRFRAMTSNQTCRRLRRFQLQHTNLTRLRDAKLWLRFGACQEVLIDINTVHTVEFYDVAEADNILSVIEPLREHCEVLMVQR